jgi:hypothetical protein
VSEGTVLDGSIPSGGWEMALDTPEIELRG